MDNLFLTLLVWVGMISWFIVSIVLIVGPTLWLLGDDDNRDAVEVFGAFALIIGGVLSLLLFLSIFTGELKLRPIHDGCYHVYYVPGYKTGHTEYDPIQCPEGISG